MVRGPYRGPYMSCVRSLQVWAKRSRRVRLERRHHDMIPTVTRVNGLPYEKWPRAILFTHYLAKVAINSFTMRSEADRVRQIAVSQAPMRARRHNEASKHRRHNADIAGFTMTEPYQYIYLY